MRYPVCESGMEENNGSPAWIDDAEEPDMDVRDEQNRKPITRKESCLMKETRIMRKMMTLFLALSLLFSTCPAALALGKSNADLYEEAMSLLRE